MVLGAALSAAQPSAPPHPAGAAGASATAPLLSVDLAAIRANFAGMRRRFGGATVAAVLKSDAYGLGLGPVAHSLAAAGCRDFWVNDLDEAARLRAAAGEVRIFCLMGLAGRPVRDFEAAGAIPVLSGLGEIEACAAEASRTRRRIPVAIQLDTGLGRLGLQHAEVAALAARPELLQGLDLRLCMTHLAAYNLPGDPANDAQRQRLRLWAGMLPPAPLSLAASSAVYMGPDWHFDMARVGSALYGVQTSVCFQEGLVPCYALTAPVLSVAEHPAGRRLGYRGGTGLSRPSRIATVAIGYANGLPQRFAEIGTARLGGRSVAIVGGIAMNMTMLDVTDLPAGSVVPGTRAIFLDARQPIEPFAERLDCAPNVLLTQIGAGTPKAYTGG